MAYENDIIMRQVRDMTRMLAKILFGNCHVDGFFLEYDSERAGGFEPLRYIQNQKVVLGLVTSKDAKLENKDEIIIINIVNFIFVFDIGTYGFSSTLKKLS